MCWYSGAYALCRRDDGTLASTNSPKSCCEKGDPFLRQILLLWCNRIKYPSCWCSVLDFWGHKVEKLLVMWYDASKCLTIWFCCVSSWMSIRVLYIGETTSVHYQKLGCYWRSCRCYCFCCCYLLLFCWEYQYWNTLHHWSPLLGIESLCRLIMIVDSELPQLPQQKI